MTNAENGFETGPQTALSPGELELVCSGATIPSRNHPQRNEDSIVVDLETSTLMVLDGLGGHADGDKASQTAAAWLRREMERIPAGAGIEEQLARLHQVLVDGSAQVAATVPDGGTTVTLARFVKDGQGAFRALVANAGDSRAYLYRGGRLEQITEDDDMISVSDIPPEEKQRIRTALDSVFNSRDRQRLDSSARLFFQHRNIVSQSLGVTAQIKPRTYDVPLAAGDIVLLTSDGVHDNLTAREIAQAIEETEFAALPAALLELARKRSTGKGVRAKPDDMSAVAAKLSAVE